MWIENKDVRRKMISMLYEKEASGNLKLLMCDDPKKCELRKRELIEGGKIESDLIIKH